MPRGTPEKGLDQTTDPAGVIFSRAKPFPMRA